MYEYKELLMWQCDMIKLKLVRPFMNQDLPCFIELLKQHFPALVGRKFAYNKWILNLAFGLHLHHGTVWEGWMVVAIFIE